MPIQPDHVAQINEVTPESVLTSLVTNHALRNWLVQSVTDGRVRALSNIQHPYIANLQFLQTYIEVVNLLAEGAASVGAVLTGTYSQPHFVIPNEIGGHAIQIVYRAGERLDDDTIEVNRCGAQMKRFWRMQDGLQQEVLLDIPPTTINKVVMLVADYRRGTPDSPDDDVILLHVCLPRTISAGLAASRWTKPRLVKCDYIISLSPIIIGDSNNPVVDDIISVMPTVDFLSADGSSVGQ